MRKKFGLKKWFKDRARRLARFCFMNLLYLYKNLYHHFGPQKWWPCLLPDKPHDHVFEVMLGAILTQNTAWTNVEKALTELAALKCFEPEKFLKTPRSKIAIAIRSAGYFRQKTKKLFILAEWYLKRYPDAKNLPLNQVRQELLALWGIGPETADSILLYNLGRPVFVIDAYTKRLLKICEIEKKSYNEYQSLFHENLPPDAKLYNEYHALIVAWGKLYNRINTKEEARLIIKNLKKKTEN